MISFNNYARISVVVMALCLSATYSLSQNSQTLKLEKRVESLEQEVKVLEGRISMLLGGKGEEIRRVNRIMMQDFSNIARLAYEHYLRSSLDGPSMRRYTGFILPPRLAQTELASYGVHVSDTVITVEGKPVTLLASMSAHAGTDGKLMDWTYSGDFAELHNIGVTANNDYERHWETFNDDMSNIAAHAYHYKMLPRNKGGGGGSYNGYVLPQGLAMTSAGRYHVTTQDTALIVDGTSAMNNVMKKAFFDGNGKIQKTMSNTVGSQFKKSVGIPRTAADSIREIITADFMNIAARALEFRRRPASQAGGGGKYTGYLSAQIGSVDGTAKYEIDVGPDLIFLNAITLRNFGTMNAIVDANGKLTGWNYTGELAK